MLMLTTCGGVADNLERVYYGQAFKRHNMSQTVGDRLGVVHL